MAKWQGKTKEFVFDITISVLRKIKSQLSIDLLTNEGQRAVFVGLMEFVDVLGLCCEDSIAKHGLTEEQFVLELDGASYKAAHDVFFKALADFFRATGRTDLGTTLDRMIEMVQAEITVATLKIKAADLTDYRRKLEAVDLDGEIKRQLDRLPTAGS